MAKLFNNSHTFQVVTDRMTAQAVWGAWGEGARDLPRPADNTPNAATLHSRRTRSSRVSRLSRRL